MHLDVAGAPSTSELLELALAVITLLAESLPVRTERFPVTSSELEFWELVTTAPPWPELPSATSNSSILGIGFCIGPNRDLGLPFLPKVTLPI